MDRAKSNSSVRRFIAYVGTLSTTISNMKPLRNCKCSLHFLAKHLEWSIYELYILD